MPLWVLLLLMGLIKVPIAVLMVWIPLRSDSAMNAREDAQQSGSDEGDGGSKTLPHDPRNPHPRRPAPIGPCWGPRRGPHGTPAPPPPRRVRGNPERAIARHGSH